MSEIRHGRIASASNPVYTIYVFRNKDPFPTRRSFADNPHGVSMRARPQRAPELTERRFRVRARPAFFPRIPRT